MILRTLLFYILTCRVVLAQPVNDECSAAIELTPGSSLESTTTGATIDDVENCDSASGSFAPGVWFKVTGAGTTFQADLCSDKTTFDTKISIFKGSCDALECVAANDDSCDVKSLVAWQAEEGVTYYVLVHGFSLFVGDFEIKLEESQAVDSSDNDDCVNAVALEIGSDGTYSTESASADLIPACGTASDGIAPGVWFTVVGTGNTILANTCGPGTEYDTQISVFSGGCDDPVCVNGNDDECDIQSSVIWNSEAGVTYYILVHGFFASGVFNINVDEVPVTDCSSAKVLTLGTPEAGSSVTATVKNVEACGGAAASTSPGVWFAVQGTGAELQASTCDGTNFDTQMSLFSGNCTDLVCVDGNDDFCDTQSAVIWNSEPNVIYYMLVHGFGNEAGDYSILVDEVGAPLPTTGGATNDLCVNAIPLTVGETTNLVSSTTSDATADGVAQCGAASEGTAPGVWFSVAGTGTKIQVSTCGLATFDTQLSLFTGDCNSLSCLDGNDDGSDEACGLQSTVAWTSEVGTEYYILLHGFGNENGDYSIVAEEVAAEDEGGKPNDSCADAIGLTVGQQVSGSTTDAGPDEVVACGSSSEGTAPGVWYKITGTGGELTVHTCEASAFDTQISVFAGTCGEPVCVAGADDGCGVQSSVKWMAEAGVEYYILVHGFLDNAGDFAITVEGDVPVTTPPPTAPLVATASPTAAPTDAPTDAATTVAPTDSPTAAPTLAEPLIITDPPTELVTDPPTELVTEPPTEAPTEAPTIPVIETQPPTQALESNDNCTDAMPLEFGVAIQGTTDTATLESVPACGTASAATAPGVWFTAVGNGGVFRASTCEISIVDTQISVFKGSCDNLECVDGNDDAACNMQSAVTWESEEDIVYYIFVHGYALSMGPYGILLTETLEVETPSPAPTGAITDPPVVAETAAPTMGQTEPPTMAETEPPTRRPTPRPTPQPTTIVTSYEGPDAPENDQCVDAIPVDLERIVEGSTMSGTIDNVEECGGAGAPSASGIWFSVEGTGSDLQASTCGTSFDTQISVFRGTCRNLICVQGNDDACGKQSIVTWSAETDVVYYVLVHGYALSSGSVQFSVEEVSVPIATPPPTRRPTPRPTPRPTRRPTPSPTTPPLPPPTPRPTPRPTPVSTPQRPTSAPVLNDSCQDAQALSYGLVQTGSTVWGEVQSVGACGKATAGTTRGMWFSVMGTGNPVKANTCVSYTDFDTQISVFKGSCNNLVCETGNDDLCGQRSSVTWLSEMGTTYYILVHGHDDSTGVFGILVEELVDYPIPGNDRCHFAAPLTVGTRMLGSTVSATMDNRAACSVDTNVTAPGVWYSIMGTGGPLWIATCGLSSYDTKISLFEGTACASLTCIGGNDDSCNSLGYASWIDEVDDDYYACASIQGEDGLKCGVRSAVSWDSVLDQRYFVLVHGYDTAVGDFSIGLGGMWWRL